MKVVVCVYKECQLMKWIKNIKFNVEDFKCILMWDHFHMVVFDIKRPLLEINNGNWYILVSIDHYSKWFEAKVIINHEAKIMQSSLNMKLSINLGF